MDRRPDEPELIRLGTGQPTRLDRLAVQIQRPTRAGEVASMDVPEHRPGLGRSRHARASSQRGKGLIGSAIRQAVAAIHRVFSGLKLVPRPAGRARIWV